MNLALTIETALIGALRDVSALVAACGGESAIKPFRDGATEPGGAQLLVEAAERAQPIPGLRQVSVSLHAMTYLVDDKTAAALEAVSAEVETAMETAWAAISATLAAQGIAQADGQSLDIEGTEEDTGEPEWLHIEHKHTLHVAA